MSERNGSCCLLVNWTVTSMIVLPVKEKRRLNIFAEVWFYRNHLPKIFPLRASQLSTVTFYFYMNVDILPEVFPIIEVRILEEFIFKKFPFNVEELHASVVIRS
jgi:hypothetical protein